MANFCARLTKGSDNDENWSFIPPSAFSRRESGMRRSMLYNHSLTSFVPNNHGQVKSFVTSTSGDDTAARRETIPGLQATKGVVVTVEFEKQVTNRWSGSSNGRRKGDSSSEISSLPSLDTSILDRLSENVGVDQRVAN